MDDYYKDILESIENIDGKGKTAFIGNNLNYWKFSKIKITDKKLLLYPEKIEDPENIFVLDIKRDDIIYFKEEGEKYREQVITGGGSGDINVAGAIIGDMIAGPAGMVLGGQRKVKEVKSETITHDDRRILLSYYSCREVSDNIDELYFDIKLYKFFMDNMPEKEYSFVIEKKRNKNNKEEKKTDSFDSKEKLKEIKQLFDEGLITKEEYDEKRKKILEKL